MVEHNGSELGTVELKSRARVRERWRTLIAEQHASGLGVSVFPGAPGRSVPTSSFYGWRRKLADPERQAEGGFVPVRLAGCGDAARSGSALEVRLRGGRRLLVRGPLQRDLLVELIGVLEGLA